MSDEGDDEDVFVRAGDVPFAHGLTLEDTGFLLHLLDTFAPHLTDDGSLMVATVHEKLLLAQEAAGRAFVESRHGEASKMLICRASTQKEAFEEMRRHKEQLRRAAARRSNRGA